MVIKDRVTAGALSGAIGAILQLIYSYIMEAFKITKITFEDFAKVFFMFKNYQGILAFMVGFITQMLIGLILGVIFAYFIHRTSRQFYYLKGLGFGAICWLGFGVFGTVVRMPVFTKIHPVPALVTLGGALIFGFANAFILKRIEGKTNLI